MRLRDRVFQLIKPLLESEGYELVDVEVKGGARQKIISVYIHKPGGVSFRDCAEVSYAIQPVLEVNGVVSGNYTLEVASPGLDRLLKTEADFRRVIGKKVRLTTNSPIGKSNTISGELMAVENEEILLKIKKGKETLRIPISSVVSGKVEIEF